MTKKKVKVEETNVVLQEEGVLADVEVKEEPVEVVETKEDESLSVIETVIEENKQEEITEKPVECNDIKLEDVVENLENVCNGTNEVQHLTDNEEVKETITTLSFKSNSEEVRYFTIECLKDGETHKKKEIVDYINNKTNKVFTDAIIINVLRNLSASGAIL